MEKSLNGLLDFLVEDFRYVMDVLLDIYESNEIDRSKEDKIKTIYKTYFENEE